MRRVRQRQQEIANQRAQEAAILKKEKQQKEKQRKNEAALLKQDGGRRLRDGSRTNTTTTPTTNRLRNNDYNPMQPWNTGTSDYRYVGRTIIAGKYCNRCCKNQSADKTLTVATMNNIIDRRGGLHREEVHDDQAGVRSSRLSTFDWASAFRSCV